MGEGVRGEERERESGREETKEEGETVFVNVNVLMCNI